MAKKFNRRQWLVAPDFQLAYIGFTIGVAFLSIAIFYVAHQYFISEIARSAESLGLPVDHPLLALIGRGRPAIDLFFFLAAFVELVVVMAGGLWISNRGIGPLERLRKHMEDTASGQRLEPFAPREEDYFVELYQSYNELVGSQRK